MQESQTKRILQILGDFKIHCLTNELYCKDDRSRLSSLRKLGYRFDETLGTCKDPNHKHTAPVKLRKLTNNPVGSPIAPRTAFTAKSRLNTKFCFYCFKDMEHPINAICITKPVTKTATLF